LLLEHNSRNVALKTLQELSNLLHSCVTLGESANVIARGLRQLMPEDSGAVFLINDSNRTLETPANWGECAGFQPMFEREACWALRRGRTYTNTGGADEVECSHLCVEQPRASICVPMVAQGEILGAMSVVPNRRKDDPRVDRLMVDPSLVETVAGIIAVALASLRLREALRESSIRDPLTGLFNRRYMEATLERELRRALRARLPLSLAVCDFDHFKRLNDTHGHEAGDVVMRLFGKMLRETFREDDVACRTGGEEFAVILPGAEAVDAARRMNKLVAKVNQQQIPFGSETSLTFAFSAGVAVSPQNGETSHDLFHKADIALYEAKRQGRNRVVLAESLPVSRALTHHP